jgi:hypothetical protein
MREICTSGSVGGEGGDTLTYPALFDKVKKRRPAVPVAGVVR